MMTTTTRSGSPSSRSRSTSNQHGVTLIETLVALSIFALAVAGMGDFMVHQIRASNGNYQYSVAYALAAEELEGMRARRYGEMRTSSTEVEKGGTTYQVSTDVAEGAPAPNLKKIVVNVSWAAPGGPRTISVPVIYTKISG